jgi:ABC-type nitrate/sulfonate/bicarbonate transport system substrate-binding protein
MRLHRWLAALLFPVLLLPAYSAARPIKVSVPGQLAIAPFHVALEKRYYADEGLEVELIQMRDTVANQALIGGNVEFATAGGAALTAIIAGLPARIVFTGFQRPFWDLYVRPELREVTALKGRSIGIPGGVGGAPDQYLREVLRRFGLDGGRDATIIGTGRSADTYTGLVAGALDAAVLSSVYAVKASEAGFHRLISFADENLNLVGVSGGIAVRDGLLQSDPALVEKFVRATLKGLLYARSNPAGTIPIWARRNKIEVSLASKVYPMLVPAMTTDGTASREAQKKAIEQVSKVTGGREPPPPERIFEYGAARRALSELKARGWRPAD